MRSKAVLMLARTLRTLTKRAESEPQLRASVDGRCQLLRFMLQRNNFVRATIDCYSCLELTCLEFGLQNPLKTRGFGFEDCVASELPKDYNILTCQYARFSTVAWT